MRVDQFKTVGDGDKSPRFVGAYISPKGETMANEEHLRILRQGVEVWNAAGRGEWRRE